MKEKLKVQFSYTVHLPAPVEDWNIFHPISRPGQRQGLLYKHLRHSFIHSFINSVSQPFPPTALRRCHAKTVRDRASSYKIDYVIVIKNFLKPEGQENPISGSKDTAILLKGWILPIGGASAGQGLPCSLRSEMHSEFNNCLGLMSQLFWMIKFGNTNWRIHTWEK